MHSFEELSRYQLTPKITLACEKKNTIIEFTVTSEEIQDFRLVTKNENKCDKSQNELSHTSAEWEWRAATETNNIL